MAISQASALRAAILTSIPADPFQTQEPEPRFVYVPRTHVRALDPDNMLVVGARGTGKSFWWHALLSEPARKVLAPFAPSIRRNELRAFPGWSEQNSSDYPDKDTLVKLLAAGLNSRLIWKTVLLRAVAPDLFEGSAFKSWKARVQWVVDNPESVAERLRSHDSELARTNSRHLMLCDALDRTADAWAARHDLLKGLLQLVLELRSTKAIRAKVFVRDDMVQEAAVLSFVDSSKVLASRVDLTWPRLELYGLLWQYMGNAGSGADAFRKLSNGWTQQADIAHMPESIRIDESVQRTIFAEIAGKAMGTNERRGLPYTWIPTHLGDANGVATPRSFLAALRTAAAETTESATKALDRRSIHSGVRNASTIRVDELAEDFPWTKPAMEALQGLNVPCEEGELTKRWRQKRVVATIASDSEGRQNKNSKLADRGLLRDLVDVGVLEVRPDHRFNIPDVYRVGFGMKRRGGVKPVQ